MIYPGTYLTAEHPDISLVNGERVSFETSFGSGELIFLPATTSGNKPLPCVIYAHGNGELITQWIGEFERYRAWGIHVALVEYPGYGETDGKPSEMSIQETYTKAYEWLIRRTDVDQGSIIGHGRSIGGGIICNLAESRPLRALILQSTFTRLSALTWQYGVFPLLLRDKYDNIAALKEYQGPVLIVHGRCDRIIPVSHAKKLKNASDQASLHLFDCRHNDFPYDATEYWELLYKFFLTNEIIDEKIVSQQDEEN